MSEDESTEPTPDNPSRRHFLQGSLAGAVLGASGAASIGGSAAAQAAIACSTLSH